MLNLLPDVLKGQSLPRAWMNRRLVSARAGGVILDIGSGGTGNAGRMTLDPGARIITTDLRPETNPGFVSNVTTDLPLRDSAVDTVLLLNVLEHVYDHGRMLKEVGRILKSGGVLYLYMPFLYPRHTARYSSGVLVEDYFRFGPQALRRLLNEAGFRGPVEMEVCGGGPWTAAGSLALLSLPWGWLRAAVAAAGLLLDRVYFLFKTRTPQEIGASCEWPLAYWVRVVK